MIWIPTGRKDGTEDAAPIAEDGGGEENGRRTGFVMGYVFDVSQTEPALDGPELYRRAAEACAASGQ